MSIMSSIGADGVNSAALVLVLVAVMEASAIGAPVSYTVHWLTAATSSTLLLVVAELTTFSVVLWRNLYFVQSASGIFVLGAVILTHTIVIPRAYAINRLGAC